MLYEHNLHVILVVLNYFIEQNTMILLKKKIQTNTKLLSWYILICLWYKNPKGKLFSNMLHYVIYWNIQRNYNESETNILVRLWLIMSLTDIVHQMLYYDTLYWQKYIMLFKMIHYVTSTTIMSWVNMYTLQHKSDTM